jgi:hypothetical protein
VFGLERILSSSQGSALDTLRPERIAKILAGRRGRVDDDFGLHGHDDPF